MLGEAEANAIFPLSPIKSTVVGGNVTISCSYKGFTGRVLNVQWYKQYARSKLKFIFYSYPNGRPAISRFTDKFDQDLQQVDLKISNVARKDSAVYYCALEPTFTGISHTKKKTYYVDAFTCFV